MGNKALIVAVIAFCMSGCGNSDSVVVDQTTPQAAVRTLVQAIERENGAAARDCLAVDTPQGKAFADAMADLLDASRKLCAAGVSRFGHDADKELAGPAAVLEQAYGPFETGRVDINGDEARVAGTEAQQLHLRRQGTQWRVVPQGAEVPAATDAMAGAARILNAMAVTLASDQEASRYSSAADVKADYESQLQKMLAPVSAHEGGG